MTDLNFDLEAIRSKMRKKKGGNFRDPNEWRCDKADVGKTLKYKFFILPGVDAMDLWYYEHGNHFIENKVIQCPRIHDGINCPLCQYGFDLMKETDVKEKRREIAKKFLSSSRYSVNIYFPAVESTPAELRDKVMWYSMPQSIYNICEEVLMKDPPEGEAVEPEPYGIFFDPNNALPFVLEAKKKGEFNAYDSSHFIGKHMPITKGGDEKINDILSQRHDVPTIFDARDVDLLQSIVDKLSGNVTVSVSKSEKALSEDEDKDTDTDTETDDSDDLGEELLDESPKTETPKTEEKSKKVSNEAKIEDEDEDLASLLAELND